MPTTTTTILTKTPELTVDEDGNKEWHIDGKLHREDGPAFVRADGTKYWYVNGKIHREDGPAIEFTNGAKLWYLDGRYYDIFDKYVKAANWTGEQIVEWKLTHTRKNQYNSNQIEILE
jgi:hypothetical protein